MKRFLVGGCAALLATACAGDPSLYLGGPAGPPVVLELSSQRFVLRAGATATLAGQLRDEVGNAVAGAVTFAPCDSKVSVGGGSSTDAWATTATITASTLGESCITATAASFTENILVRVVPGTIVIVGPDTVLSGQPAAYSLEFYSLDGTLLDTSDPTFVVPALRSLNTLRLPMTSVDPLNYDAAGQQPGPVFIQIFIDAEQLAVSAGRVITIVPGTFLGTLSATSGEPFLDTLVIKPQAGRNFDGDEFVTIGGQVAINWTGRPADAQFLSQGDSLLFMIPVNLPPGSYETVIFNQGPLQIAEVTAPITVVARSVPYTTHVNPFPGANTAGARMENKRFPLSFPAVLTSGSSTTDRSVYTISPRPAALPLTARLEWIDPTDAFDIDLEWINGAFTTHLTNAGRTGANPEVVVRTVAAANFEFIRIFRFSGTGTIATQMTLTSP